MSKKIAHICTSKISYKILKDKLGLLAQRGFKVHFISSNDMEDLDWTFYDNIKQHYIEMHRSISIIDDIKSIFAMAKLLKKEQFDIVHTHTAKAGFIGRVAAKIAGVPLIVHTSHGLPFFDGQNIVKFSVYKFFELLASKFCDYVGSQNYEDLHTLSKYFNQGKLYYEGNGVNLDELDRINKLISHEDLGQLKREWNIHPCKKVLLVGARFEPVKDHLLLIESLSQIRESGIDNFCCLLAGIGPLENELKRKVKELGLESYIKFLGFQTNIYPWIKLSDLVILTSRKEGIPRIIMESMAFCKAVVATDVLGTRELVEHNVTGLLSPYKNVEKLAFNISLLLKNDSLREKFGSAGRRRVEENFTEDIVVKRIAKIYECI